MEVSTKEMFGNSGLFNLSNSDNKHSFSDIQIDLRTFIYLIINIGLIAYGILYHSEMAIFAALIGVMIYFN